MAFGLQYDGVLLLADAVSRADSLDPSRIRDALVDTKAFHGVTGNITMDKNRDPISPLNIYRFEKGSSALIKTVGPQE
jgi:branched-chain amino acid transport system substrate-binding protein